MYKVCSISEIFADIENNDFKINHNLFTDFQFQRRRVARSIETSLELCPTTEMCNKSYIIDFYLIDLRTTEIQNFGQIYSNVDFAELDF